MNSPVAPFFTARVGDDGTQCDAWPEHTLLASMEAGGIDWPSSCRNGSCRSCMALMREGEVVYRVEWPGLLAEEKAEGWILPCCAYPRANIQLDVPRC